MNPLFARLFRMLLLGFLIVVAGCWLFISDQQITGRVLMITGLLWEVYTVFYYFKNRNKRPV